MFSRFIFLLLILVSCDNCDKAQQEYSDISNEIKSIELRIDEINDAIDLLDPIEDSAEIEQLFDELIFATLQIWDLEERANLLKKRSDCI